MRLLSLLLSMVFVAPFAHALERQPLADFHARREALAAKMAGGVAVVFGNYEPELEWQQWRQDEDFYYLTGWNEPGAVLLVEAALPATADRPATPYRETLFLPTRNLRMEKYTGEKLDAANPSAAQRTGVEHVEPVAQLVAALNEAVGRDRRRTVWYEQDSRQAHDLLSLLAGSFGLPAPNNNMADLSSLTAELRTHKDAGELALLRKASDASVAAQLAMMRAVHPGQKERTLEGILDAALLAGGCERPSYPSIVGSGVHSTELHYADDDDVLKDGDVMVVDAAGEYSMYASDITRTVPVNGKFSPRQLEIYNIVLGAQQAAIDGFVAGKSHVNDPRHTYPDSLDTIAWKYMNAHGHDAHGGQLGQYFIHGIGHGVGLDVHDPRDYDKPLGPGDVFTIEPGIYIPEEHLGVRIEDVFYVKGDGGLECLTCALPEKAEEVERVVSGK